MSHLSRYVPAASSLRCQMLSVVLSVVLCAAAHAAAHAAADPPTWEIVTGSKVPTPVQATAVRGRMPGFLEPDMVYVLAFVNFNEAPSRQLIPELDRVQTEHGKKAVVVAITDEGPDAARRFIENPEWAPRIGFTVAADPLRSAFRAFFGPQRAPTLPMVFVMRNGVVQWAGAPVEISDTVSSVVRGTWDMAAAKRAAAQRELWRKMLADVEALAAAKRFDDALIALKSACESAIGDQRGQCLGVRFSLLLRADRLPDALIVGEQIVAAPMNPKQPAGLAWTLMSWAPENAGARAFALRAAQSSDTALHSRDPMVCAILGRAQYMNGQRTQAIETVRRALSLADTPDLRNALRDDLRRYEAGDALGAPSPAPSAH